MDGVELFERREELRYIVKDLSAELKEIDEKLEDLFLQKSRDTLRSQGKDFGTATIAEGNSRFKINIPKKVKWDNDMLKEVFEGMNPDDANHFAKVTFSVDERVYNAAHKEIRDLLEPCRVTEMGKFKIDREES